LHPSPIPQESDALLARRELDHEKSAADDDALREARNLIAILSGKLRHLDGCGPFSSWYGAC
jgi:hypothetical protein